MQILGINTIENSVCKSVRSEDRLLSATVHVNIELLPPFNLPHALIANRLAGPDSSAAAAYTSGCLVPVAENSGKSLIYRSLNSRASGKKSILEHTVTTRPAA